MIKTAKENGYEMKVLKAVEEVNEKAEKYFIQEAFSLLWRSFRREKPLPAWGLAFKPETDDMREATALVTIDELLKVGCKVRVYDPIAMDECHRRIGEAVEYAADMY